MNPHILIIEDEREIAELVELALARSHQTVIEGWVRPEKDKQ